MSTGAAPDADLQAKPPIRVLLADDQAMVRAGFRMIIESQPDLTVVAEADNGRAAVELAQRVRPDVCLLDIRMPVLDGLEATRLLAGPDVVHPLKVVIATTFDSDEHVQIALRYGAAGFILKDSGPQLLLEAIRAAAAGDALISPSITVRYLDRFVASRQAPVDHPLSARELDVARAVARGLGNQEIAAALFISLSTVKTHLANVQLKLHLRNRVEIAIWVLENDPDRPQG